MAFTVEDGTIVAGANAYVTVAYADDYHTERGNSLWTGSDTVKQQAIVRATDYIDGRYSSRFIGYITDATQALCWPRTDAASYDTDEIPEPLKRACAEYALRALSQSLAPDPVIDASGYSKVVTRRRVGPIETYYQVDSNGIGSISRPYPLADMQLRGLVVPGGTVFRA